MSRALRRVVACRYLLVALVLSLVQQPGAYGAASTEGATTRSRTAGAAGYKASQHAPLVVALSCFQFKAFDRASLLLEKSRVSKEATEPRALVMTRRQGKLADKSH